MFVYLPTWALKFWAILAMAWHHTVTTGIQVYKHYTTNNMSCEFYHYIGFKISCQRSAFENWPTEWLYHMRFQLLLLVWTEIIPDMVLKHLCTEIIFFLKPFKNENVLMWMWPKFNTQQCTT